MSAAPHRQKIRRSHGRLGVQIWGVACSCEWRSWAVTQPGALALAEAHRAEAVAVCPLRRPA